MIQSFSQHMRMIAATLLLFVSLWANADEPLKITVLLSGESQLYLDAVDGISEQLDSIVGLDYSITTINNFDSRENIALKDASEYIIAVGSKAARYISNAEMHTAIPVLNILVSKRSYQSIYKNADDNQYSVIYLDQPAERILLLTKLILEGSGIKIGMLFGPTSAKEKLDYFTATKNLSLQLVAKQESSSKESLDVIESLITTTDAYVALYDREVLNRKIAKWLLYMANVHRKPVVAYSKSYVEAGAVAAVYTTPYDAGVSAANWLVENVRSDNKKTWRTYPQRFTISINRKIATKLNLAIDDSDVIATKIQLLEAAK